VQLEPAVLGTYGDPPSGHRLPAATRLGGVVLRVADLARSVDYYETVLGLRVLTRTDSEAVLTPHGDDRALVTLRERKGARAHPSRGRLGLFHFAILMPDRASLARFVQHLLEIGVRPGAGDHGVSEAFYLQDPDNLGIEVYADRPRSTWTRRGKELAMGTDPMGIENLLTAAGDQPWTGMPTGTVMGHLHLHVGDLATTTKFYSESLGLDRMVWSYPGALFLAAGGYHHQLGTNTRVGPDAQPAAEEDVHLLEWTIECPSGPSSSAWTRAWPRGGHSFERNGGELTTKDPWGHPAEDSRGCVTPWRREPRSCERIRSRVFDRSHP
jgi:catechol 2,3-dioxygenase